MQEQEILICAPPLDGADDSSLTEDGALVRKQNETLRNLATLLQYGRDQVVYGENKKADHIYFISSGVVRVFRSAANGKRQIISFRTEGDLCGLPQSGRYVNSAEAVTAARIYRVPWQLFHQVMLTLPYLQDLVLRKIASDFHQIQSRIVMLGQESTLQRVASFLISMMPVAQFFDAEDSLLHLPMNRFDMADYLGTRAETAGRALTRLEHMEIIQRLTSSRIRIIDENQLRILQRGPRRDENGCRSLQPAFPSSRRNASRDLQSAENNCPSGGATGFPH